MDKDNICFSDFNTRTNTSMEQGVTGIELCALKEVAGGCDMVQSKEVSNDTVGIESKSPQAITVAHIPLVAGLAIGGNLVLSSQEDLDPIDRDLAKFDQNGSGVSVDESNLRIGLSQVSMGSTVAGSAQFLKNFSCPQCSNFSVYNG